MGSESSVFGKSRLNICKKCPLFVDTIFGPMCDSKTYMDMKTKKVTYVIDEDSVHGCGCLLLKKVENPSHHCPTKQW